MLVYVNNYSYTIVYEYYSYTIAILGNNTMYS